MWNIMHWLAKLATKVQRIADTSLQLKPDVVLLQPDEHNEVVFKFSWQNIASFLQLISEDYSPHLYLDLIKAYSVFITQPGFCFVTALSITN